MQVAKQIKRRLLKISQVEADGFFFYVSKVATYFNIVLT